MIRGLTAELELMLAEAGVTGLVPLAAGDDNQVYAACVEGRELIVKVARTAKARFGVAAWAAAQLAAVGVPVPTVLCHSDRLLVETRCSGIPLNQLAAATASAAGRLLRRIHSVPVRGYGRLDTAGVGVHPTARDWLLQPTQLPATADVDLHALRAQAINSLRHHLPLLAGVPASLLHGDWAARHVIVEDGGVTGVVDLESVRGGDPLADLAGWSLQEPAELTRALYAGYFTTPPDQTIRTRLALYRVRIATAMLARHVAKAEHPQLALRTAQLRADLADLACQQPAAQPRFAPPSSSQEGPSC